MSVYNCISHILYIICKLFPQEICIELLEKKILMTICFPFICFRCCGRFHVLLGVFVCVWNIGSYHVRHLFPFVLAAFRFINYVAWNDIITIKQRRKKKILQKIEVYVHNAITGSWSKVNVKYVFTSHLKQSNSLPPPIPLGICNFWVPGVVIPKISFG